MREPADRSDRPDVGAAAPQAEHSASKVNVALAGLSVRHGMITDFESVSPAEPTSRAIELTLQAAGRRPGASASGTGDGTGR